MYCIDWGSDGNADHITPEIKKHFDKIQFIRKNSHDAHYDIPDNSLDFCYIDASHDYHDILADIHEYYPKVKEGGVLCGHDYNLKGVNKAVFDSSWEPMPDIDSDREKYNVVSWEMATGDCVAFNGRIIHGGSGQLTSGRELQVFNTQWLGNDVKVHFKSYGMDPDHTEKMRHYGMNSGDAVEGTVYPEFNIL